MNRSLALSLSLLIVASAWAAEPVDYQREIKPILQARCYACHGALKQEAGLRLDTGGLIRKGGESGPAVIAEKPAASLLIERIAAVDASERMPPEGSPLSPDEIAKLRLWIEQGALSPESERPEPDPREHWAFHRIERPALPTVKHLAWSEHPLDRFLAAEHERLGLVAAEPAAPEILLRRVYLDLIGIPPRPEELKNGDYEATVNRLLASPQYGERWARHWMDIWRYSDWYGRRGIGDVRNSYPHVWRWRDWIVRSLNEDKGYDRMLAEMLAADELAPEDDETIAATGYLVRSWYSLNYDQWMRDLVEHTGKAFLGLRLNCALCHDHKYDPVSQRDYFAWRALFEPLELRQDRVPGGPPLARYVRYKPGSNASHKPIEAGLARVYEEYPDQQTRIYRGGDYRDVIEGLDPVPPSVPAFLGVPLPAIEPVALPPVAGYPGLKPWVQAAELARCEQVVKTAQEQLDLLAAADPDDPLLALRQHVAELDLAQAQAQLASATARIAADRAKQSGASKDPVPAKAAAQAERQANLATARHKLATQQLALAEAQGNLSSDPKTRTALDTAEKNVQAAATSLAAAEKAATQESADYTPLSPTYPVRSTGRRSALAAWLTHRDNPLVARVAVNHVWGWHFGKPLVATTHDLGRSGAEPTNAALLDWLAVELMESGWSLKHLHRLILTSRGYQMSSDTPTHLAQNAAIDKPNQKLWRFERQRLEAEVLRDSLLSVAGLLDERLGGPDIDNAATPQPPRRSLYFTRYPEDGGVLAFTAQFDPPDPGECYRRSESLVPQQALALVNSDLTQQASRALAARLLTQVERTAPAEAQRQQLIELAFRQILSRPPRLAERELCAQFLADQAELHIAAGVAKLPARLDERAAASLVRSLLSHHDFITIH